MRFPLKIIDLGWPWTAVRSNFHVFCEYSAPGIVLWFTRRRLSRADLCVSYKLSCYL